MGGGSIRKKEWILGGGCLWLREVRTPFLEAAYNFAHDTSGREEYKLVAGPFLYFPTSLLEDIIKVRYHTFHIFEEFFNEKYLVLCCLFAERLRQKGTAEGNCASAPASATRGLTFNPFGTILSRNSGLCRGRPRSCFGFPIPSSAYFADPRCVKGGVVA